MDGTLGTTNGLLAILAAVAVLEVIALIAASVVGWIIFRNLRDLLQEVRQQVPRVAERMDSLAARLEDVLVDVKDVSARTAATAERVHHGFDTAADVASMAVSSAQMVLGRKAAIAGDRPRPEDRPGTADDDRNDSTTFKEAAHGS